jgi:hypothetical protein
MPLEPDIVDRIQETFVPADSREAMTLITGAGKPGRLARCLVIAAQGSLERLKFYLHLAEQDYRDLIVAGEYLDSDTRIRDLRVSFLIDAPSKLWIGELAVVMAARRYVLSSVSEVAATFEGGLGRLQILKKAGIWKLVGDQTDFETQGLTKSFRSERQFTDAVSGYLLVKRKGRPA